MKIDLIIPAYKAQDTIFKTLSSIAVQTIIDDINVTIVNDCDGIGYKDFVDIFSPFMKIQEITLQANSGPGLARQFGIDNTINPMIMFVDADDIIYSANSIRIMRDRFISNRNVEWVLGSFVEEFEDGSLMYKNPDESFSWMFAKVYSREFINRNKIRFNKNSSMSNEDVGFNKSVEFCLGSADRKLFVQEPVYLWKYQKNSITRKNDDFIFNECITGFVDNVIYAIENYGYNNVSMCKNYSTGIMIYLYIYYLRCLKLSPNHIDIVLNECKVFYNKVYKKIENSINSIEFNEQYSIRMSSFLKNPDIIFEGNELTFKEFLRAVSSN